MNGLTHRRSHTVRDWAVCGAVAEMYVDAPTCLWCVANKWGGDDIEMYRILMKDSLRR